MTTAPTLKLCLVDMNNGLPNQAIRCFHRILDAFTARVTEANPGLRVTRAHVQPRNLDERVPMDSELTLSSGGPGSPFDGYEDPWCVQWRGFLDHVIDENRKGRADAPALLNICHSFELASQHLGVGTLQLRDKRKFGVMPVYPTEEGQASCLFREFGDRLFAFENRSWEVVELDEKRLRALGGALWARESRDGVSKGRGLTAFRFAPGVEGTIFHPEGDREGMVTWVNKPDMASAFKDAYGEQTYEQMMDTINDPMRVARTFSLVVPGFLHDKFNRLAAARGWRPIAAPVHDVAAFA